MAIKSQEDINVDEHDTSLNARRVTGTNSDGSMVVVPSDISGNTNFIGVFGEQLAVKQEDEISVQFQYALDYQFDLITPTLTGDGAVVQELSYLKLSSTTGSTSLKSRDNIRYKPGHTGLIKFTASFTGSGTGRAGGFDTEDGFFIEVINGVMSFNYRNNGSDITISQSSFNGEFDISNLDLTKINIFMVEYGFLGVANPTLWVKKDKWHVLHTESTEGTLTTTHVGNPVFPICMETSGAMEIKSGSWNAGVMGNGSPTGLREFHFPNTPLVSGVSANQGEMTLSGTNVGTIAVFHVKTLFKGKTNKVKTELTSFEFKVDTPTGNVTGEVVFQILALPTLSGTPTYTDINTNSSVMEYDHTNGTGASVSYSSGGFPIITTNVGYVGSNKGGISSASFIDAEKIGAAGYKDETFAIIAKDIEGNNVKVRVVLNWEELF